MDNVLEQFDKAWPEIKIEFGKDPKWTKTQGFGHLNYYFQLAEESKQDLKEIDKEINSIRHIKINNRDDFEIRSKCEKIIDNLMDEKRRVKCTIQQFQSIGQKQKKKLKTDGIEENQNSPQG